MHAALVAIPLLKFSGNPEWFIHFGRRSTVVAEGRRVLGPRVLVPHGQGQDGQTFWLMARDPLLLHPARLAAAEDRPAYREQRVLYPLVVAPFRALGERAMVWALLLVNLAAVGLGAYFTARLARAIGAPDRMTWAFVLNPAVVVAVFMDASDALAIALVVAALAFIVERRMWWAAAAFAAAALTKEVALLAPAAVALTLVFRRRDRRDWRAAVTLAAPAFAATVAWAVYVRVRLGWPATKVEELAWPFGGFGEAYRRGWRPFHDWGHMAAAVAMLVLAVAVVVAWAGARQSLVLTAALPFALLFPFLSGQVLDLAVNSVRAAGPLVTLLALGVSAAGIGGRDARRRTEPA